MKSAKQPLAKSKISRTCNQIKQETTIPRRFERPTSAFAGPRSIQLSYGIKKEHFQRRKAEKPSPTTANRLECKALAVVVNEAGPCGIRSAFAKTASKQQRGRPKSPGLLKKLEKIGHVVEILAYETYKQKTSAKLWFGYEFGKLENLDRLYRLDNLVDDCG